LKRSGQYTPAARTMVRAAGAYFKSGYDYSSCQQRAAKEGNSGNQPEQPVTTVVLQPVERNALAAISRPTAAFVHLMQFDHVPMRIAQKQLL
jgi:hypothetical protein